MTKRKNKDKLGKRALKGYLPLDFFVQHVVRNRNEIKRPKNLEHLRTEKDTNTGNKGKQKKK